ncbi:FAD-binding monooxygenase [Pseudonocardia sp. EC080610-09]|uniref:FAD-dependent monooxygenase n=1 Tax=unclassified Pseudonocardia TaxID=2619320 RepID=UPI0006CB22BB|nr:MULTISPECIES: FAD-dependent monooxygenase [unclassified Pseudonocardia]ALE73377.1 FAD-binding monooxygenase [Pseudonocardia sp. EC080625-04]ALL77112.1 FAD-binding monooxygenase [Pseudonocardia sp. EC080610-09]ALL80025.1 FAD-binding monooxygenase [Pseudonocardia sp. EC080619-01]
MKIVCVGGGPAGLYFALSAKLRDAGHEITVLDRDPPGATYGWGVVYKDNLLDTLYRNDAESGRRLRAVSALWQEQEIRMRGRTAYLGGYGYSVGRAAMQRILTERATDLGVEVLHEQEVAEPADLPSADLVVAADGANSRVRTLYGGAFGTTVRTGGNPYIWLGTDRVFSTFVFDFVETPSGWVWCYAYPTSSGTSTFIVECRQETWDGLGLATTTPAESTALMEQIFAGTLRGHRLIGSSRGEPAQWRHFPEVVNERWHHDGVVLVGDAAHTTHFTIGSGTRLAILDAVSLAHSLLGRPDDLTGALNTYERQRRRPLQQTQASARSSMAWFEQMDRYTDRDVADFAAAMCARLGPMPPWRYRSHRAIQYLPVRKTRRWYETGRRTWFAVRRGEPVGHRTGPERTTVVPGAPAAGTPAAASGPGPRDRAGVGD